jgi:tetraacyldisaccharide 4'-kinase
VSFLQRKTEKIMTHGDVADPAFSSPFEWALYACSRVYRMAVTSRIHLYESGILEQRSLPCTVVSIGNMTVGGTGKTPMVAHVAGLLKKLGHNVAVVSRGYGGHSQRSGGVVSDGKTTFMKMEASGDEPQLLASKLKGIPVLVSKDRYQVGMRSINEFGSSVLVLDDAFQHLPLKRDLNLLLLDSARPFGNGHCLPRGTLREPVEQMKRASALILTRWPGKGNLTRVSPVIETHAEGRPVFRCMHVPDGLFMAGRREPVDLQALKRQKLFLFSGIGRNDTFRETVSGLEGSVVGYLSYRDHHRYSQKDVRLIWQRARDLKADKIITTEKDYVNIQTQIPSVPQLFVLTISISFEDDTDAFEGYLKSRVGE